MATKKNELVAAEQEMGLVERPDWLKDTGRGNEGVGINELTIPRIEIIQDLSPQRKKSEAKYIPGAEEGMAFNSVSSELYGSALIIIPVFFQKEWVIWKDRKKGGGFAGAFASELEAEKARRELADADDYAVLDTHQHYVLVVKGTKDNLVFEEAVMSMSKSKMKASRQLNTLAKMAGGDRFSRMYRMEVVPDQNKNGDSYFNWRVSPLGYVTKEMYTAAEALYNAVSSGQRAIDRSHDDEEAAIPRGTAAAPIDGDDEF